MPKPETVEELAEALADMLGIHNRGIQKQGLSVEQTRRLIDATGEWHFDHAESCGCRLCWCAELARRIRAAVASERIRNNPIEGWHEDDTDQGDHSRKEAIDGDTIPIR